MDDNTRRVLEMINQAIATTVENVQRHDDDIVVLRGVANRTLDVCNQLLDITTSLNDEIHNLKIDIKELRGAKSC